MTSPTLKNPTKIEAPSKRVLEAYSQARRGELSETPDEDRRKLIELIGRFEEYALELSKLPSVRKTAKPDLFGITVSNSPVAVSSEDRRDGFLKTLREVLNLADTAASYSEKNAFAAISGTVKKLTGFSLQDLDSYSANLKDPGIVRSLASSVAFVSSAGSLYPGLEPLGVVDVAVRWAAEGERPGALDALVLTPFIGKVGQSLRTARRFARAADEVPNEAIQNAAKFIMEGPSLGDYASGFWKLPLEMVEQLKTHGDAISKRLKVIQNSGTVEKVIELDNTYEVSAHKLRALEAATIEAFEKEGLKLKRSSAGTRFQDVVAQLDNRSSALDAMARDTSTFAVTHEALRMAKKGIDSPFEHALLHPRAQDRLTFAQSLGYKIVVDPSMLAIGIGGDANGFEKIVRLAPNASMSALDHELAHAVQQQISMSGTLLSYLAKRKDYEGKVKKVAEELTGIAIPGLDRNGLQEFHSVATQITNLEKAGMSILGAEARHGRRYALESAQRDLLEEANRRRVEILSAIDEYGLSDLSRVEMSRLKGILRSEGERGRSLARKRTNEVTKDDSTIMKDLLLSASEEALLSLDERNLLKAVSAALNSARNQERFIQLLHRSVETTGTTCSRKDSRGYFLNAKGIRTVRLRFAAADSWTTASHKN